MLAVLFPTTVSEHLPGTGALCVVAESTLPCMLLCCACSKLYVWNWKEHTLRQSIELGADGAIPLEIRFAHEPSATWGFVVSTAAAEWVGHECLIKHLQHDAPLTAHTHTHI